MRLDEMDSDIDTLKQHRHMLGVCMDCAKDLRGNKWRCPSCCRRCEDIQEYEVVFNSKSIKVR
jgi:hypothetical protein